MRTIAGVLNNPDGSLRANQRIIFYAVDSEGPSLLADSVAELETDGVGAYSIDLELGRYAVELWRGNIAGIITVEIGGPVDLPTLLEGQ